MKKRKILTIDGGGIKGVIPAAFLKAIEEHSKKRIVDHFDLIAGTSTGGIIALGLGLGLSAREVLNLYEEKGPYIFDQAELTKTSLWNRFRSILRSGSKKARQVMVSKYKPDALRKTLNNVWGNKLLGDSKTRLVVPAFNRQRHEVHIYKTAHHERLIVDHKEKAVDVALATSAAPTYFPAHKLESGISLLDGGIWANNPTGLAVVEAIGVLGWSAESIYVLSLGCSEEVFPIPENAGFAGLALKATDIFLLGQSRASMGTAKILTYDSDTNRRIYRYDQVVPKGTFALDSAAQIAEMKGVGTSMAREATREILPVFFAEPCEAFIPFHLPTS